MTSTREDKVAATQLFQITQSLELWRVDYLDEQGVKFNVTMDWIIEYLQNKIYFTFRL